MDKRTRVIAYLLIGAVLFSLLIPVYLGARELVRARNLKDRLDAMTAELAEMNRETRLVSAAYVGTVRLAQGDGEDRAASGTEPGQQAASGLERVAQENGPTEDSLRTANLGEELSSERAGVGALPEWEVWQPTAGEADAYSPAASNEEPIHRVYLTFDDGPSVYTDEILDILAQYDVKATFFVVGRESEDAAERYRRIVREGHTLGMHSYSHRYTEIYASEEAFRTDLKRIWSLLVETTGEEPKFYRFPGGSSNTISDVDMHVFADCLAAYDITYFDWNSSSGDASGAVLSAEQIAANAIAGIQTRSDTVILMHDAASKYSTVRALPAIIESIQAMGNTQILPITEETPLIQHVSLN